MVTIEYSDLLLTILTFCVVFLTAVLIMAVWRAWKLLQRAEEIAEDLEALTAETRRSAVPVIRELGHHADNFVLPIRHLSALIAGTKAGLSAFVRQR